MEIIKITEHQQIIINEDNITYLRTDLISEEFKNRVFLFSELKMAAYQSGEIDWLRSLVGSAIVGIITFGIGGDAHGGALEGEGTRIKLVFRNSYKYIDVGEFSENEVKVIVLKINQAIKKWHAR